MRLVGQEISEDTVVTEGFYPHGWESSAFYEIRDSNVYKPFWMTFHEPIETNDSLLNNLTSVSHLKPIYIKVE